MWNDLRLPPTQCSATCGKGMRMRYVSCRDNQGGVAEESACSHLSKPPAREVCSVGACGQWKALEWSQVRQPQFSIHFSVRLWYCCYSLLLASFNPLRTKIKCLYSYGQWTRLLNSPLRATAHIRRIQDFQKAYFCYHYVSSDSWWPYGFCWVLLAP